MKYEGKKHLHIGYYEDGHDIEGAALKVEGEGKWHVFFNFGQYGLPVPVALRKAEVDAYAGVHVFTVSDREINNRQVHKKLGDFAAKDVIPLLKEKSRK